MMFLFSSNWLDERLNVAFAHLTRWWVKITGKDNFALFRHTFVLAIFCHVGVIAWALFVSPIYLLGALITFAFFFAWLTIAWRTAKRLRFISQRVLAGEPLYLDDARFMREACHWRCYLVMLSIGTVSFFAVLWLPLTVFSQIPLFPLGMSLYFASHFTGGGTSAFSKMKEKLKALAESVNLKPATIGA